MRTLNVSMSDWFEIAAGPIYGERLLDNELIVATTHITVRIIDMSIALGLRI